MKPRARRLALTLGSAGLSLAALAGCEREHRDFATAAPGSGAESIVRTSALQAGPATPEYDTRLYLENRWAVAEGQRLYSWYNCAGCHSPGGGGGMGPPHTDDLWIYGSAPENIYESIVQGRPHGMPSYSGRLASADVWKLVAYVRSLGGLTPFDTWPARAEMMEEGVTDTRGTGPVLADSSRIPREQLSPRERRAAERP